MFFAKMVKHVVDTLWLVGGIGAAADLGLDEFASGGYEPCPREEPHPHCANQETAPCPHPCPNSSSAPLSR